MERTDMATPEKIIKNDKFPMTNSQSPPKSKPARCYPPGDALELTLAFPFLTRGQHRIMRGHVAELCAAMRGNARLSALRSGLNTSTLSGPLLAPVCTILENVEI